MPYKYIGVLRQYIPFKDLWLNVIFMYKNIFSNFLLQINCSILM